MSYKRMFKKSKSNQLVRAWLKTQSDPDDAIVYLIQKEFYENGQRDLAYIIPKYRNAAYFEQQTVQKSEQEPWREIKREVRTMPSDLGEVRAIKEKQKVPQVPSLPVEHINKIKAVHHVPDHKTEDVIMTEQNERDLSHLDLTCFDD